MALSLFFHVVQRGGGELYVEEQSGVIFKAERESLQLDFFLMLSFKKVPASFFFFTKRARFHRLFDPV